MPRAKKARKQRFLFITNLPYIKTKPAELKPRRPVSPYDFSTNSIGNLLELVPKPGWFWNQFLEKRLKARFSI
ncbi:hypothetical protein TREPR_1641 [Treponema primitia ZAS-2]|uniref:Uncharacterized protein n=1 Tax=Treponema primitia (strain ATCC BAA-887 / DSM 12427 / ZAS-2) TaxID=545694 RepID=F5YNQ2_TREPZ|nr:hypothetical protein TREPR_1641 [Treponema primitia ZAS-2]